MKKAKTISHVLGIVVALLLGPPCSVSLGQGMGGGGNNAPAFSRPKFRDRVWEEGGPRLGGLHDGKLVKAIQITGNHTISSHKILSLMQTRVDRNYDERQLLADISRLYDTDLIRKVVPLFTEYADGIVIGLKVVESPSVSEVVFHGNTRLDDKLLQEHAGIDVGDPANPFTVETARQRLTDLYREKGLNSAVVEIREGNKSGDRRVFFDIYEGPVERIWAIHFVGNEIFSTAVLNTKIRSRDARMGLTAHIGNVANIQKIEDDKRIIVAYYRSLGYFQARVDFFKKYHPDGDFLDLTFVVDEGPQSIVQDVVVIGNQYDQFPDEVLLRGLESKVGKAFNLGRMNRDVRRIRNEYYGREGFVFVDIEPQINHSLEPGKVDLVINITEGARYRAGDINVHIAGDSSYTKYRVVMNLLGIREGQYIDLQELENSETRLKRSQLFEVVPSIGEPPSISVRPPEQSLGLR